MLLLQISKYSASGNDFVIFHTFKKEDRGSLAKRLCNRATELEQMA